jgi:non-canonical purine NTP pyrophosphatase (RdgB/HAM1 family)
MKDIVFITGNQSKADYLAQWLDYPIEHQKVDVPEIQSVDPIEVVSHKAYEAYKIVQRPVLVEDTSLTFEALGGKLPGTLIKWFLQEMGNEGMLRALSAFSDRRATASLVFALYDGKELMTFKGSTDGTVPTEQRGSSRFGKYSWNTIFIPNGSDKTFGEMTDEELKPFSHRAKAIAKIQAYLSEQNSN